MMVAVCCIGKLENHYIREFVEHYKSIGVDKIFLYDNNDVDGERFEDVIGDYINEGFVKLIDYRGRVSTKSYNLQSHTYKDFYRTYGNDYDWIFIIDCDEYLNIDYNVKDLLSDKKYDNFEGIRFQWKNMTDNNLICVKDNNYNLKNRFPDGIMNKMGKSVIRGGLDIKDNEFHGHAFEHHKYCDVLGNPLQLKPLSVVSDSIIKTDIYFRHYNTKTIQEFIDIKMKRLYPDRPDEIGKTQIKLDFFFHINKKTKEKLDYIKSRHIQDQNNKQTTQQSNIRKALYWRK